MIGDKILVKPHHTKAAEGVYELIKKKVLQKDNTAAITVAGESGSGKSEIAYEIARFFSEKNSLRCIVLAQDDYFMLPPKSNDANRRADIRSVGMQEVRIELLNEHLLKVKSGSGGVLKKPLIDYGNNKVLYEDINIDNIDIVIAEGTYTTVLKAADIRVFIDRDFNDTLKHRRERARDTIDNFIEEVLKIEHSIISLQKDSADIIINNEYSVISN